VVSKGQAVSSVRFPKDAESWPARAVCRHGRPNIVKGVIARPSGRIVRVNAATARGSRRESLKRREEDRELLILGLVVPVGVSYPQKHEPCSPPPVRTTRHRPARRAQAPVESEWRAVVGGWRQPHGQPAPTTAGSTNVAPGQVWVNTASKAATAPAEGVRQGKARRLHARGAGEGAGDGTADGKGFGS
jgi:hypothetical protein